MCGKRLLAYAVEASSKVFQQEAQQHRSRLGKRPGTRSRGEKRLASINRESPPHCRFPPFLFSCPKYKVLWKHRSTTITLISHSPPLLCLIPYVPRTYTVSVSGNFRNAGTLPAPQTVVGPQLTPCSLRPSTCCSHVRAPVRLSVRLPDWFPAGCSLGSLAGSSSL